VTPEQSVTPSQRFLFIQGRNKPVVASIIDGKTIAADLRGKVKDAAHRLLRDRSLLLGIAVVLVGKNPASEIYVRNKSKAAIEAGMRPYDHSCRRTLAKPNCSLSL
jgi:methylenetetrahydrofolate dehydrogenase (NADP+)/methenyltetrahydrofolate cyclohydrolase